MRNPLEKYYKEGSKELEGQPKKKKQYTYERFLYLPILEYIKRRHKGNKAAFARAMGVMPQQVTKWVKKKYIIADGVLYSPINKINKKDEKD